MASVRELLEVLKNNNPKPEFLQITARKKLVGGACSAEDILSESTTVATAWEWSGLVRNNGGSCRLTDASLYIQTTNLTPAITVYLFKAPPTSALNDNVANTAVILADRELSIGQIDFPSLSDLGGMSGAVISVGTIGNLPIGFTCASDSIKIYGISVTRTAVTPTAGDLMLITLGGEPF